MTSLQCLCGQKMDQMFGHGSVLQLNPAPAREATVQSADIPHNIIIFSKFFHRRPHPPHPNPQINSSYSNQILPCLHEDDVKLRLEFELQQFHFDLTGFSPSSNKASKKPCTWCSVNEYERRGITGVNQCVTGGLTSRRTSGETSATGSPETRSAPK